MRLPALLPTLLLGLALSACTATATGSITPGAPSANPGGSAAGPSASPGASPSAGVATMGAFSLTVAGVDYLVDTTKFTFSPTDLLGKRLRFGLTVGGHETPKEGEGYVSFLVGEAGGVYPRFSITEKPSTVFSVQASVYPKGGSLKGYQLTTNTSGIKEKTVTAENGRVQGVIETEVAREVSTLGGDPPPREQVRLSFDFTQAAPKP